MPSSWCHWRTYDETEMSGKKKKTAPWWYENTRRYWELNEEAEDHTKKVETIDLSHEHKEEIQVSVHKFMDLLTISIVNNNDSNSSNNNNK